MACLFPVVVLPQSRFLGIGVGYGKTDNEKVFRFLDDPLKNNEGGFIPLNASYRFTPAHAMFQLKTGLNLDIRNQSFRKLYYARVPLGMDLKFGKQLFCNAGTGFYFRYSSK
ncbi:MAG: hypothetical protein JW861_11805 [Bacteroidales bacterium]|nr:hypothetical protein [Bacteroidales bacterium]